MLNSVTPYIVGVSTVIFPLGRCRIRYLSNKSGLCSIRFKQPVRKTIRKRILVWPVLWCSGSPVRNCSRLLWPAYRRQCLVQVPMWALLVSAIFAGSRAAAPENISIAAEITAHMRRKHGELRHRSARAVWVLVRSVRR